MPTIRVVCTNGDINLAASDANSYSWAGPGVPSNTTTQAIGVTQAGTYSVTVITNQPCTTTVTQVITQTDIACCQPYGNISTDPEVYQSPQIGDPNSITVLSGDHVFDGQYHIVGPLLLTGGRFHFMPGTIFYIDGQMNFNDVVCGNFATPTSVTTANLNFIQVEDGVMYLQGAILKANCSQKWGGVRLTNGGRIVTDMGLGIRPGIEDAFWAIRSFNGTACDQYNSNYYFLRHVDIRKCAYGLIDFNKQVALTNEGMQDCRFLPQGQLPPIPFGANAAEFGVFLYLHPNLTYSGNYLSAVFKDNYFENCDRLGFAGRGSYVKLENNTFLNIGRCAIDIESDPLTINQTYIYDNNITFTAAGSALTVGIRAHYNTQIYGNTITGAFPLNTSSPNSHIGILCDGEITAIGKDGQTPNTFRNLSQAIHTEFYDYLNLIQNNFFEDNYTNIFISGTNGVLQAVDINCNTMTSTSAVDNFYVYGIEVEPGAMLSDQGDCNGLMTGNLFDFQSAQWESLYNDISNLQVEYYHGNNEVNLSNTNFNLTPCNGATTDCSAWNFANGVTRIMATDSLAVLEMMDSLRLQVGNLKELAYYERQIKNYHISNGYISQLQAYTNSLPAYNQAAYNNLALHLLRHYRNHGNTADLVLLRSQLLANNTGNQAMEYEVKYFDLQSRMGNQLLGYTTSLSTQDSTDLAEIASSGTAHWLDACLAISHFYPNTVCNPGNNKRQRNQPAKEAIGIALGNAYPNPASSAVSIPYHLPKDAQQALLQIAEATTGRLVHQQLLSRKGELVQVELENLKPGIYSYTLVLDGVPNATRKLVVIK